MTTSVWKCKHFYGHDIGSQAIKEGWLDYGTLAKAFPHILNNNIISETSDNTEWDMLQAPECEDDDGIMPEIMQYYIIDEGGKNILEEFTDDYIFYNDTLDMYVWGVTHCGTGWDYVMTNVKLELQDDADE